MDIETKSNAGSRLNSSDEILNGQERPTPHQMLWVLSHLAESFDQGKSFSRVLEDAVGEDLPRYSAVCSSAGTYVNNALQCCRESKEAMEEFNNCWC